ncbi:unnamed protein product [Sphenostylis stenocarpa]|uniref:Uncharacterized protein n=1 Tax=Sphenostylis stenocarpa TaxID=92480 RepID=A0AA86SYC8_9FABA|nr:unnamed protein product [Sphenostylis stenocarpa]
MVKERECALSGQEARCYRGILLGQGLSLIFFLQSLKSRGDITNVDYSLKLTKVTKFKKDLADADNSLQEALEANFALNEKVEELEDWLEEVSKMRFVELKQYVMNIYQGCLVPLNNIPNEEDEDTSVHPNISTVNNPPEDNASMVV